MNKILPNILKEDAKLLDTSAVILHSLLLEQASAPAEPDKLLTLPIFLIIGWHGQRGGHLDLSAQKADVEMKRNQRAKFACQISFSYMKTLPYSETIRCMGDI